jgi:DNA end-binding protein Ku
MASTVWKGYLTFGLISIPIRLFAAARAERISFNQLHKVCHSRLKQQLFCPTCNRAVDRSEIVKGYEYAKDAYVLIDDEEIKKIAPPSASAMEIQEFVRLAEVDPLYFDTSYYAVPDPPGRKPYRLLVQAMEEGGYAAVAKIAMHQREYVVLIRARANGLTLHTMHYKDDVREVAEYGQDAEVQITPQELELARKLVETLAGPFQPDKYRDEYQHRLQQLIEAKQKGAPVAAPEQPRLAPVIDLMEALQKSLALKKPPARAVASAPPAEAEPAKARRRKKAGAAS